MRDWLGLVPSVPGREHGHGPEEHRPVARVPRAAVCCPMLCTTETGGCRSSGHYTPCWETCPAITPAQRWPLVRAAAVLASTRRAHSRSHGPPAAFALGLAACPTAARHLLSNLLPLLP